MRLWLRAAALAVAMGLTVPAMAQEKTGSKPGFTLQPGSARIVLMRPAIRVGAQSTGGMFEPNADWTTQARGYLEQALQACQTRLGNQVVSYDEALTGESALVSQYANLFGSLADSVIEYQFFRGNRLPTKVRRGAFDWSIGTEITKLQSLQGADYALFINTHDAYGSTGRKALQIVGMLAGVAVISGEHWGYAGLIDLKTGELVWLNADRQMGGDVRAPEGAVKRVRQLLEGFPGRNASSQEQVC